MSARPPTTTVHLLRHGEVHNPAGVLYGRLPGYALSRRGEAMAEHVAEALAGRDVALVRASPLERAQRTAAPVAGRLGLVVGTDRRLLEAGNVFEGRPVDVASLRSPRNWHHFRNPLRPSWGEPYGVQARRVLAAVADARTAARGREAVLVSHQLPIWTVRRHLEGRRLWHDPRRRECSLASLTSLTYVGDDLVSLDYAEPARDLLPARLAAPAGA